MASGKIVRRLFLIVAFLFIEKFLTAMSLLHRLRRVRTYPGNL